jgi:hypothetical protein
VDDVAELRLAAARALQVIDERLDILRLRLVGDQHRVGGGDDHQVLDADRRQQPALGKQDAVVGIDAAHVATPRVAVAVNLADRRQRVRCADVVPAGVEGNHDAMIGLFHDRVVDRVRGAGSKGGFVETEKVEIPPRRRASGSHLLAHHWREALQRVEKAVGTKQEHAAVPEMVTRIEVGLRRRRIGLLDKAVENVAARQRSAAANVTVAGFRSVRQGYQRSPAPLPGHAGLPPELLPGRLRCQR